MHGCIQIGPDESGDGEDTLGPAPFAGTWVREVAGCYQARIFGKKDGAFAYEISLACELSSGGVGIQAEVGTYNFDPPSGVTTFTPQRATCRGRPTADYLETIALNGPTTLVAETKTSVEVYESSPFPIGPNATPGCFDANGGFVPSPLAAL